jgi:5-dehydro-2-deoxygluconokinase
MVETGTDASQGWDALEQIDRQRDPWCRGAVILGLNQPMAALADSFSKASSSIVKGFMVGAACGPTVAALAAPDIDDRPATGGRGRGQLHAAVAGLALPPPACD